MPYEELLNELENIIIYKVTTHLPSTAVKVKKERIVLERSKTGGKKGGKGPQKGGRDQSLLEL